jgi:DNA-binding GntR family transcriptional regulator
MVRRPGPEELVHLHQVRETLEGMAVALACRRLTPADDARRDALADAARDRDAPGYLNAFDAELHRIVALRSGNPIIAREVVKLHGMTLLIHEQLEAILIEGWQAGPADCYEIRRLGFEQHMENLSSLRTGTPEESRREMVEHIRSNCAKAGMMPPARPAGTAAAPNGRRPTKVPHS